MAVSRLFHLSHTSNNKRIWDTRPAVVVVSDACPVGGGAFCTSDWLYRAWHLDDPSIQDAHINVKELAIVEHAARRWCEHWRNQRVLVFTDNSATLGALNNDTSASRAMLPVIRRLSYLAQQFNFSLQAVYIPGHLNVVADSISRLHMPGYFLRFIWSLQMCGVCSVYSYILQNHMSPEAAMFLSPQARAWNAWHRSWTRK